MQRNERLISEIDTIGNFSDEMSQSTNVFVYNHSFTSNSSHLIVRVVRQLRGAKERFADQEIRTLMLICYYY